jgi:hypothetical protein
MSYTNPHRILQRARAANTQSETVWVIATAGLLGASILASLTSTTFAPAGCDPAPISHHFVTAAGYLVLFGGGSALAGLVAGRGVRWWFLGLVLLSPVALLALLGAALHTPAGCPGPFS